VAIPVLAKLVIKDTQSVRGRGVHRVGEQPGGVGEVLLG
jgi:hypothetical protein